ncbi:glycosyltransferase family 2 protein [Actinocorallia sp. API 0066]|uniref:glycosyltransferase family 2 protein n=1 Tax=Actinocorallia sp. API 0066 TaxID=2896846 RepID=UPI001E3F6C68|nr:glycosyltransferase family 2 protein [Actinocorallia sp. API 0066]MCD0447813.1 glycosyltransferase family 2 protein [Actinocorallia sp. API 0066]
MGGAARGAAAVSVVVATRDRPGLLERAVRAALDQRYAGDVEVLVVFDQVEPRALDVGELPEGRTLRTLRNTRTPGLPGGRNTGIDAATGAYVAFCDDDDHWVPDKLAAQLALFAEHPGSVAVGSGVEVHTDGKVTPRLVPYPAVELRHLLRDRVFALHPSTVTVHRERLLARVGYVDEEIPGGYAEDYDFVLRIAKAAPIPCVPRPLTVVTWGGSFFADRFAVIADALAYLLDRHPEFADDPEGRARIEGQIAFYRAASGARADARGWAVRALRGNWREPRSYLALAMGLRLVSAPGVLRALNARGRGV